MSDQLSNDTTTKKGGSQILIIIGLFIALAVFAFLWSQKNTQLNECTNENLTLKSDMEGMNQMMSGYVDNMSNDLKADFKNMLSTYDKLIEKDASKADSLNMQKQKIQGLIDEINKNKRMSASQLFQLRKENETLRKIMRGYVTHIDSLNTLNIKLTSDLDKKTTELTTTSTERDSYKQLAEEKDAQVKKGSKLQAYGFRSIALRMKLNNTTEETNKANKAVQIKSSFTIGANPISDAGSKMVYLQVISPDGRTLQAKSSYELTIDGSSIPYSDKKEIDYKNESIDVSIFYDLKGEEATKGNYKVKIYCDGSLIGTDSFMLK
jgi:hypothetical protein